MRNIKSAIVFFNLGVTFSCVDFCGLAPPAQKVSIPITRRVQASGTKCRISAIDFIVEGYRVGYGAVRASDVYCGTMLNKA